MTDDEWERRRERAILAAFETGRPVFADSDGDLRFSDGAQEPVPDHIGVGVAVEPPQAKVHGTWWQRVCRRLGGK